MIHLIIAEASLELVPKELFNHPALRADSKKAGKKPGELLLDSCYHHTAMENLSEWEKRGRPDIIHISLLNALGSPLNLSGNLKTYVHTINSGVIEVNPEARLPRNYLRFKGIFEQLLSEGKLPTKPELLTLRDISLEALLKELKCKKVLGFSRTCAPIKLSALGEFIDIKSDVAVIVGGFPKGTFSKSVSELFSSCFSISPQPLEAWIVVSRVLGEFERMLQII